MKLTLRIRELRKEKGLTLEVLADVVGVSKPHLSGIERGLKNLNNRLIESIAKALDVQPFELFLTNEDVKAMEFVKAISKMDPSNLEKAEQYLDFLHSQESV